MARADQKRQRLYRLSPERCALPQGRSCGPAEPDPRCPDLGTAVGCGAPGVAAGAWRASIPETHTDHEPASTHVSQAFRRRRACRLHGDRPVPRAGRSVLHADSADHGADVLKIEPPGGDETRLGPPFLGETASYFIGVNRNKRGMALDLSLPAGQERCARCWPTPTCWSRTSSPARWRMGLGLRDAEPGIPEADPLPRQRLRRRRAAGRPARLRRRAQAMCGLMSVNGEADGEATRVGLPVVDMVTGLNAAVAVLLALNERAQRPGPVPGHHAVRLRAVAAAPARAQLFLQRQDAGPQRQRASQHRAL